MRFFLKWWQGLDSETRVHIVCACLFATIPFALLFMFWALVSFGHWLPWPGVGK